MKRIAVFAALAAFMMVLPAGASAEENCSDSDTELAGGTVGVTHTVNGDGEGGLSDSAENAVGACVDTGSGSFQGGAVEAGQGDEGVYAVVDGDDANTLVSDQGGGYVGVSTFEDGDQETACDQGDTTGSGTNSGGCFAVRDRLAVAGVPLACGNTTGKSWDASSRDGCTVP